MDEHHTNMIEVKTEILNILEKEQYISLSTTTVDNTVRSRTVDFVSHELNIGFFSWMYTRKIADIKNNPHVALCVDNVQIEGRAAIHSDHFEQCQHFVEVYQQKLPDVYEKFRKLQEICFVTIEPTLFIMMKYEHESLFLYHLDTVRDRAYIKKLSDW